MVQQKVIWAEEKWRRSVRGIRGGGQRERHFQHSSDYDLDIFKDRSNGRERSSASGYARRDNNLFSLNAYGQSALKVEMNQWSCFDQVSSTLIA